MKALVIGSGGREHALAWKLAQSSQVERVYVAPGNGGTAGEGKCENVPVPGGVESPEGRQALLDFAQGQRIGLTIAGSETPLAAGIVDLFRGMSLPILGPDKKAARLEASKIYAKSFMRRYGVQSARSRDFTEYEAAQHYADKYFTGQSAGSMPQPLVIKADGLAGGKGVVVASTPEEAGAALCSFMREGSLGGAGQQVVLEEFLEGREVSVLAAVRAVPGGPAIIRPFIAARDYKRRFDGGQGPNTGGMGAIAPAPDFSPAAREDFKTRILKPSLYGLERERLDYRGFIFFGLMIRGNRCFLLEYNVRLGDPATQAVLPLMESDFAELCMAIQNGDRELADFPLAWKRGAICAPVAVAAGYPGPVRQGDPIVIDREKLAKTKAQIFVAGAELAPGCIAVKPNKPLYFPLLTTRGRVLTMAAKGGNRDEAYAKALQALEAVHFEGMDYRKDIGLC